MMKNVGWSSDTNEQSPKAVLEIKMAQNPINRAFLRPIFPMVIAWIGVQTTPARLKHTRVKEIVTVDIFLPYLPSVYKG